MNDILAIKDINLKVKKGEFICIIGDVGSGKSSLLAALIGDLQYLQAISKSQMGDKDCSDEKVLKELTDLANNQS